MYEKKFNKANEMLEALRRNNDHWQSLSRDWIFRGQARAEWPLLPSTLRPEQANLTHHPERERGPYPKTLTQIEQEIRVVQSFVSKANYYGLPIPGEASTVMRMLEDDFFNAGTEINSWKQFPRPEVIEAYALAQHHGIPTRLLDWTKNPLTAAYFAASGAARNLNKKNSSERFGVWCFNLHVLGCTEHNSEEKIVIVDPPRSPNPKLLAQNGVFTLYKHPLVSNEDTYSLPFDQVIQKLYANFFHKVDYAWNEFEAPLVHFTLPTSQSRHLLRLLAEEDVTAAKLFPSYDGISQDIWEGLHLRQNYRTPPEEF